LWRNKYEADGGVAAVSINATVNLPAEISFNCMPISLLSQTLIGKGARDVTGVSILRYLNVTKWKYLSKLCSIP
jgi:hypothetical protein